MGNIRIKDIATTASSSASDDFLAIDGATNGTRKLNAYSPTFGGNLTVNGTGTSTIIGPLALGNSSGRSGRIDFYQNTTQQWLLYLNPGDPVLRFYDPVNTVFALQLGGASGSGTMNVGYTTNSSSTSDGALVVAGGVGVAKSANIGGNLTVSGRTTIQQTGSEIWAADGSANRFGFGAYGNTSKVGIRINTSGTNSASMDAGTFDANGNFVSGKTLDLNPVGGLITTGGSLFVGKSGDSSNGILQLATHTTSAGGIGFGTDASLYRYQAGGLALDATNNVPAIMLRQSGTNALFAYTSSLVGYIGTPGAYSLNLQTNNTTALTLDSSQNATFAGRVAINNTVQAAVAVASTHKVTISIGGVTYYLLASNV